MPTTAKYVRKRATTRNCIQCGVLLSKVKSNYSAKYCSADCGTTHRGGITTFIDKGVCSTASTGAAAELIICADLLRRGHSVFRSASPACSYDLVSDHRGALYRIEVKAGSRYKGRPFFPKPRNSSYDVLAVVFGPDDISYSPHEFLNGGLE